MTEKKEQPKEEKGGASFKISEKITEADYQALLEPWVTEKSHVLMAQDKYVFKVQPSANKSNISRAVAHLYNVTVEAVNVVNIHSKKRFYGRKVGTKQGFKKAVVTLKKGDKIELFEGV